MSTLKEFKIDIPQSTIEIIIERVRTCEFPDQLGDGWEYGISYNYMKELADYWVTEYDWRQHEASLNKYPQFISTTEGFDIHFYHVKGSGTNPLPLIFTHGWPGSVFEFVHLIEPLTNPEKFGGNADDAFDVVIPSLPGFGFSSKPKLKAVGSITTAKIWHKLMTETLGYYKYGAQGGDFGSVVTAWLAHLYPESVAGIHFNLVPYRPAPIEELTEEEKEWQQKALAYTDAEFDYFKQHFKKTQTVAFALSDSPIGAAAWILEKFKVWSDSGDSLEPTFSKDQLLTNIMIYLVTKTIGTSIWYYRGWLEETGGLFHPGARITVPTGVADFPRDMTNFRPPQSWIARDYNLTHYTQMPKGGHFASLEQPDLFTKDVCNFFKTVRPTKT